MVTRDNQKLSSFTIQLTGIPVVSDGRWFAVILALGFAFTGMLAARGTFDRGLSTKGTSEDDRRAARELILQQLVDVERARAKGALGPKAYDELHRKLVDALARLGSFAEPTRRKKSKRRLPKRAQEASTG
jgi:hypothetical protein